MEKPKDQVSDSEDIPSDFFDDFSKDDFIDSLSVIDSWDDADGIKRRSSRIDIEVLESVKDLRELISDGKDSEKDRTPKKRSREGSRLDEYIKPGSRRDPNKTNEAIRRDKEVKVKELLAKQLESSDNLRPPGTELDDFFDDSKPVVKKNERLLVDSSPHKFNKREFIGGENSSHRRRSKSRERHRRSEKYGLSSRHSPRRSPRHSPRRMIRQSPRRDEHRDSPRRSPRHSPGVKRSFRRPLSPHRGSPNRRSPHRRSPLLRTPHLHSPHRRSPHRRSPHRRSPHRRSSPQRRSPNRHSPNRRSPCQYRSRSPVTQHSLASQSSIKDNFLYPNDPGPSPVWDTASGSGQMYSIPVPPDGSVPATGFGFPPGTNEFDYVPQSAPSVANTSMMLSGPYTPMAPAPQPVPAPIVNPVPAVSAPPLFSAKAQITPQPTGEPATTPYDALAQLVAAGKLSHEDYLKLAPSKGASNVKNRVAVLNRCYAVLSKLGKLVLPNRLIMNNDLIGPEPKSLAPQYCSPLKRQANVDFHFTKSADATAQQNKQLVDSIIHTVGLEKIISRSKKKLPKEMKDAAVQTTKPFCDVCEIRETTRMYESCTSIDHEHFSSTVHTQVVEHELVSSKAVFNPSGSVSDGAAMSIAHMTPAQLVSQLAARAKSLKQADPPGDSYSRRSDYKEKGFEQYPNNYSNYRY